MKKKVLLIILLFTPYLLNAQTDSLTIDKFTKKVNTFRNERLLKPLHLADNLNQTAEDIIKRYNNIKGSQSKFNNDSVRSILRKHHIFDYQFRIVENNNLNNSNSIITKSKLDAVLERS